MPLYVNGELVQKEINNIRRLVQRFPLVQKESEEFTHRMKQSIRKEDVLLYIHQREYATVSPHDENVKIIGSEDATTCHIVVLRDKVSGTTSLAHFDGHGMKKGISDMIDSIKHVASTDSPKIEMFMAGGFLDEKGYSKGITQELLDICHEHDAEIHLRLACVSDLNSRVKHEHEVPVIYGIGVDVRNGDVFPAGFHDKGPDVPLRHARAFCGDDKVQEVYSSVNKALQIGPFIYSPMQHAEFFASAPAELILKYLSSSPHCEPPSFVDDVRRAMEFLAISPEPHRSVFPGGLARTYRRDSDGEWKLC